MPQHIPDSHLKLDLVAVTSTLKKNVRSKDIKTLKESNNILCFTRFRTGPCFFDILYRTLFSNPFLSLRGNNNFFLSQPSAIKFCFDSDSNGVIVVLRIKLFKLTSLGAAGTR